VAVYPEKNVLLISGSVPGPKKGLVVVKSAVKANGKVNEAADLVSYEAKEAE
ncbi:MAG TPA: 50S ribosomal protein L3, partial [Erysipelotrichaceae bacterium]|nr:50S ribosomal protein L3 [Erysipelotrichaceae bacterium]